MTSKRVLLTYGDVTCRGKWLSFSHYRHCVTRNRFISQTSERLSSFQHQKVKDNNLNFDNASVEKEGKNQKYSNADFPDSPPTSLFAKMIVKSSGKLQKSKYTSNSNQLLHKEKIKTINERLLSMTNESNKTITTIQNLMEEEYLHSDSFKSEIDLENTIEVLAFGNDSAGQKPPSPLHGTEDQSVEASNIPCTGCGAMLQVYFLI